MITLFENAGIIGLGLIGGSLARAIRQNGLAKTITGYTKSPQSSSKALELSVIDAIAESVTEIAENCDIIIICTPLSTYKSIIAELKPVLSGKATIITDVGSLKVPFIEIFEQYLGAENMQYVVPAHPIAGTEKTGVEAGFAELFQNKKTIITPLKSTNPKALEKISQLWQSCGSTIVTLEANEHDIIYAQVSHLPQFIAYCYASLLRDNASVINDLSVLKNDSSFMRFTRICASDPNIWLDIFMMNRDNLLVSLDNFVCTLPIQKNTDNADYTISMDNLIYTLPVIISATLKKCSPNAKKYAGTGFGDLTCCVNSSQQPTGVKEFNGHESEWVGADFIKEISILSNFIKHGDSAQTLAFMQKAVNWYRGFRKELD